MNCTYRVYFRLGAVGRYVYPLPTPAIVLIGAAAAFSEQLAWFDPERDAAGFAGFLSLEGDNWHHGIYAFFLA